MQEEADGSRNGAGSEHCSDGIDMRLLQGA